MSADPLGPSSEADCISQAAAAHRNGHAGNGQPAVELEEPDDPHRLARFFLARHLLPDGLALRCWGGEWYRWNGTYYRKLDAAELTAGLVESIKAEFDRLALVELQDHLESGKKGAPPTASKVTRVLVANAGQALCSLAILPTAVQPPAWIDSPAWVPADPYDPPRPAGEIVACRNGLLHLPGQELYAHTSRFWTHGALDYDYREDAGEPAEWLRFLAALWPDDPEAIATLQEWFGYSLTHDTRQQKILLIVGPKRSGKGTIARVMRGLVGVENTAGPTLASLGTNFGLWPLIGKPLAIISDARLSGRSDAAIVVERLLSISGEDAITIDRKNLAPLTVKLPTRFVVMTNELPRLTDASGAMASRMVVLRLTRTWYGQEDHDLTDKLLGELPAILNWSIEGWQRLRQRGRFVQPESGRALVEELEDLASPIGAFLREECVIGPEHEVFVRDLFDRWKTWCERKGRKDAGTEQAFWRDLRAAVPALDCRQHRTEGERVRKYVGLGLL